MQEIHSMGGTRFFGAAADRRLRPHHHHPHQNTATNCHQQQALKCPRCDSLNTKFCYYNNYNLSQPRHFCKNCRRYWTKGGVLRNVPVGGGCRKSKRSNDNKTAKTSKNNNSNNNSATATSSAETPPQTTSSQAPPTDQNSNSHSSSESSNLTAAAAAATIGTTELNSDSSKLLIHENNNNNASSNPNLESGIFSEIGTLTSLMVSSSSNNDALAFGFGGGGVVPDATSFQWHQQQKLPENLNGSGGSLLDHHGHGSTVTVDLSALPSKTGNGGFGPLDWQAGVDQGLFDLPNSVDHAYWSQTQWPDHDNSNLFHLP
ncbi:hypothetical protein HN51_063182 [Arachis hypogaea]|uniref:Dof zinc finger protein n=1 Tax=Arachis hypogaea TaxID=3818 RepID=A0A445AZ39_ARAHY|nr:dof zinc finger protein DOF5.4 [Arachis ipaensis]XP_025629502.1 dof zinc finger protein DOF5.4 [Arachis hypogaea]QHO20772.1 Dof zinc finger protein [Arachis hypogaea]RYR31704.1 hypothetical protein Ahy_B01g056581 [Arachis hypogaea]